MSEMKTGPDFFKDPAVKFSPLIELANHYFEWLAERAYSKKTIQARVHNLSYFMGWLIERGIHEPVEVTRPIIERYQRFMFRLRKKDDKPLSFRTQSMRLIAVRTYFKWLAQQHYILHNPASEIVLPRTEKRLPKHILNAKEAEEIMSQPDINAPLGLRDRAILETFYSTGIRRTELSRLNLYDVDADNGTLMVRQGKGKKDRMIPIGERALFWLDRYLSETRPELAKWPDDGNLFLSVSGKGIVPENLTALVRNYVDSAGIQKSGSCHLFRHTMATLLLENGADIRFIQTMLGHASLESTQIYTQVSIRKLKSVHEQFHPARMPGRATSEACDQARMPDLLKDQKSLTDKSENKQTNSPDKLVNLKQDKINPKNREEAL